MFNFVVFTACFILRASSSVLQANIVYRHGDRSPIQSFPTDSNDPSVWPQGFGQLTQLGMYQHYQLGGFFKNTYMDLINSSYVKSEVTIRSTDFDRTLMSAYSNLAGLFRPQGRQIWNEELLWQPIPVHTVPVSTDILLGQADCMRYNELMKDSANSAEVLNVTSMYTNFFKTVSTLCGIDIDGVFSLRTIYDTLFCERSHNLTLPAWAFWTNITGNNRSAYEVLHEISDFSFKFAYNTREKQRLTAGSLIGQIRKNMNLMLSSSQRNSTKMFVYSAHDTTVAALLSALNVFDYKQPNYAAAVMIDLRNDSGQINVALSYKNGVDADAVRLTLPGCNDTCSLAEFYKLTNDVVPVDWNMECRNQAPLLTQTEIIVISVCACITLCLAMTTIIYYARRKRATPDYEQVPHDSNGGYQP